MHFIFVVWTHDMHVIRAVCVEQFLVLVGLLHSLASGTSYLASVTTYWHLIGQAPGIAGL